MNTKLIRRYAVAAADGYISQYVTGNGRVMNDPVIVMDDQGYIWSQSSLTPLEEDEIVLETLQEGMFGSEEKITAAAIKRLIMTDVNFQPPFVQRDG